MYLLTVRFFIALALSTGLAMLALAQPSTSTCRPAADATHAAPLAETVASARPLPPATADITPTRSPLAWRSLLPGSMR